jgi:hypothetical protein
LDVLSCIDIVQLLSQSVAPADPASTQQLCLYAELGATDLKGGRMTVSAGATCADAPC